MPTRNRSTDACPGVLATHQAADGAVARVRVPGGQLTAAAFAAIAGSAAELGDGTIELTSRANLQARGLADGEELSARLSAAGLLPSATHERVRNVLASPLTGRDGAGLADVRPLVADLDRALCARSALAALPGRFLFAVDDGRGDVAWLDADVAAVLTSENTAAVLLAGVDAGLRAPLAGVVDLLLRCAETFLTLRDDEWRLAELPAGPERIAAHLPRPACPGGAPRNSERPEGDRQGIGRVAQVDGRVALVVGAPLGWLDRGQAAALVATGAPLVVTPWRRLVVADLPPDRADAVADRLRRAGLLLDPADPVARVTACTGRPGCAKALADVRAAAAPVPGTTLPVHWSGCARRCGRPRGTVVDVVATGHGYSVTEGDR
ncbi:precorrin-3B synthase [Actinophytocola sp.]|uniref:precorrin-3B synthase n=1 Tax=Actinophytocola sp. TaxID=1872138 RepID=UPI00389A2008